jgi:hypothetical protein
VIALFLSVLTLILWVGRHEFAEILVKLWISYKRWTGYSPRRPDGPRIRSTVIAKKEWEEVA